MTFDANAQPVNDLLKNAQYLREQSHFAHRQATNSASRASKAVDDLAALNVEGAFRQVRKLVSIVGGDTTKPKAPVVEFEDYPVVVYAAE